MKAEVLKGLMMMREGLDMIINSAEDGVNEAPETAKPVPTKAEKKVTETEVEAPKNVKGHLSKEQLDSMTYNDLKKLAKEIGVSASGARPELTARILGEELEVEEEVIVDVSDAPEEEPTGDETADKVRALVADMSIEEIADVLAEVGISAKGKREALIEKLINAVDDGLIELDDSDEDTDDEAEEAETEEAEAVEDEVEETEATDEDEDYDPTNDPENPNMTKERKAAIEAFDASTRQSIKEGEITVKDMRTFLAEFHDMTVEDLEDYSDEEITDFYIDAAVRFIDDDGEIVEEEAYMLNGEPACCGHTLTYNDDESVYHCAVCGNDYNADEE